MNSSLNLKLRFEFFNNFVANNCNVTLYSSAQKHISKTHNYCNDNNIKMYYFSLARRAVCRAACGATGAWVEATNAAPVAMGQEEIGKQMPMATGMFTIAPIATARAEKSKFNFNIRQTFGINKSIPWGKTP